MELVAPWFLAGLAFVPAIFLWGLLAPRGRRMVVGSLLLWKRALGGGPAGKPSARLRVRDPLLWLDAVLVLLIVLACARPALHTRAPLEPVATIVLDRTASMGTRTGDEDGRRCDRARKMMAGVLDAVGTAPIRLVLVPDDSSSVAVEETTGEDFRRRFVGTCGFVRASPGAPGLPTAVAEAARRSDRPVVFVTDVAPTQQMPGNLYILATGGESRNVGLRRVAVRGDRIFVSARASADAPGACDLHISDATDRDLVTERAFVLPGQTVERIFQLPDQAGDSLCVRLDGPDDEFDEDNEAVLAREAAGPQRILLVGDAPLSLRRALASAGDTAVAEAPDGPGAPAQHPVEGPVGEADLVVVYASALPADWQGPAALVLPPDGAVPARRETGEDVSPEWRVAAEHPLADALYLEPPRLASVPRYALEPSAEVLLGTPDAPLIVTWEADGVRRLAVLFAFDESATDWPRRAGFPVFWRRALEWLVPRERRPAAFRAHPLFEPLGAGTESAPDMSDALLGSDEGFQAGPARDDTAAAVEAIRRSVEARRRATLVELWPYLAAAAVAVLLVRARMAR